MGSRKPYVPVGKSAAEIRAETDAHRDAMPLTTRCALCNWIYHGTAYEGRELARGHRRAHHPQLVERRRRRNNINRFNPSDDGHRNNSLRKAAQVAQMVSRRDNEAA